MIDTLRLNLTDCEIKKSANLTIQQGFIENSTGKIHNEHDLFVDSSGKIVKGSKAYYNHDKFNLTINPTVEHEYNEYNQSKLKFKRFHRINREGQDDLLDPQFDDEAKGIYVQTSLPRLINENNLKNLKVDEQITALKELETLLKQSGIRTNIFNAKLSRVDTFTNLNTEFSFFTYADLFSLMELSRMKAVGYGNESFLWKNGNQQLMIYDKILEMKYKNPELKLSSKRNIMRLENRLLKKRSIESKLKLLTVKDLYKNYNEVKEFHKKDITKKVFKYSLDQIENLTIENLEGNLLISKNYFGRNWFQKYCNSLGAYTLSRIESKENIKEILINIEGNKDTKTRMKVSRILKLIDDSKHFFNVVLKDNSFIKSNVQLYNELKTKFYKEVA